MTAERVQAIKQLLYDEFTPIHLDVMDDSAAHRGHAGARSGGGHFNVTIVSARFQQQDMLTRHRLVYAALQAMMRQEIHALRLRTLTPEEYQAKGANL